VFAVSARLHALLGVADRLEHGAALVERVRIVVLLLAQLRQHNAHFITDVADGIVARLLAPLRQLCGDRDALLGRRLVRRNQVVLRLDQPEEPLGELGLRRAAQGREAEAAATVGV